MWLSIRIETIGRKNMYNSNRFILEFSMSRIFKLSCFNFPNSFILKFLDLFVPKRSYIQTYTFVSFLTWKFLNFQIVKTEFSKL